MNLEKKKVSTRRQFIKASGGAAASALAGVNLPAANAQGSELIRVAFVGCGGRGSGAVRQALSTKTGPIKLVAMADAFEDRLNSSYEGLVKEGEFNKVTDVPKDRR